MTPAPNAATSSRRGEMGSYNTHPIRVMLAGRTDAEQIVGVLHDVVEDTLLHYPA